MRNLETVPDGYNEVETYVPGVRDSFEKIRCLTESGMPEFLAEVKRVERIRAEFGSDWDAVTVRLVSGETELERMIVA